MTQEFTPLDMGGGPLAISPDGTRLATANRSSDLGFQSILLWDLSGHFLRRLNVGQENSLSFSPDGRWLVTSDAPAQFSRDRKTLLTAPNAGVRFWDAATGKKVRDLPPRAVNSSARFVLWNLQSGKPFWSAQGGSNFGWEHTATLAFSPNGQKVAVGSLGGGLLLYNVVNGHLIRSFIGDGYGPSGVGTLHGILFSRDGRLLIGAGGSGIIREWNVATGAVVASLVTPGVQGLTPLPGKQAFLAMVGRDIEVVSFARLRVLKRLRGHDEDVDSLALTPDGRTLWSAAGDGTVKRWNLQTGMCAATYGCIRQAVLSPDGKMLAYSLGDSTVTLRDLATGRTWATLHGFTSPSLHTSTPSGYDFSEGDKRLVFSPNGRMLAGGTYTIRGILDAGGVDRSRVVVWDLRTKRIVHDWEEDPSGQIAFSPDSRQIALMAPTTLETLPMIRVRALPSGRIVHEWNPLTEVGHPSGPEIGGINVNEAAIGFTAQGRPVLAAAKETRYPASVPAIWDVATGHLIRAFSGWGTPGLLALSANAKLLSSESDTQNAVVKRSVFHVRVGSVATGKLRSAAAWEGWARTSLVFGGNKWAAMIVESDITEENLVRIMPTAQGQRSVILAGGTGGFGSLSFSADGQVLAYVSGDGPVRVWKYETTK